MDSWTYLQKLLVMNNKSATLLACECHLITLTLNFRSVKYLQTLHIYTIYPHQ